MKPDSSHRLTEELTTVQLCVFFLKSQGRSVRIYKLFKWNVSCSHPLFLACLQSLMHTNEDINWLPLD